MDGFALAAGLALAYILLGQAKRRSSKIIHGIHTALKTDERDATPTEKRQARSALAAHLTANVGRFGVLTIAVLVLIGVLQ